MTTLPSALPAAFPKPTLTPIEGRPTPANIQLLTQELYQNALSQPSTLGGGSNGHIGMVMTAAKYAEGSAEPYIEPTAPPADIILSTTPTDTQIHAANYQRQTNQHRRKIRAEYLAVKSALTQQLLAAVEEPFYSSLRHNLYGYHSQTPLTLLQHFTSTYGQIEPEDLLRNREQLQGEWNPDDGMEALWDRITHCQAYANGTDDAISDTVAITLTLKAISESGVMTRYVQDWKLRPAHTRTMTEYKTFFNNANKK